VRTTWDVTAKMRASHYKEKAIGDLKGVLKATTGALIVSTDFNGLISNAIRFRSKSRGLRVGMTVSRIKSKVELIIEDNGLGVLDCLSLKIR